MFVWYWQSIAFEQLVSCNNLLSVNLPWKKQNNPAAQTQLTNVCRYSCSSVQEVVFPSILLLLLMPRRIILMTLLKDINLSVSVLYRGEIYWKSQYIIPSFPLFGLFCWEGEKKKGQHQSIISLMNKRESHNGEAPYYQMSYISFISVIFRW